MQTTLSSSAGHRPSQLRVNSEQLGQNPNSPFDASKMKGRPPVAIQHETHVGIHRDKLFDYLRVPFGRRQVKRRRAVGIQFSGKVGVSGQQGFDEVEVAQEGGDVEGRVVGGGRRRRRRGGGEDEGGLVEGLGERG